MHNPRTNFLIGIRAMNWLGSIATVSLTITVLLGFALGGVTSPWASLKTLSLLIDGGVLTTLLILWEAKGARHAVLPLRTRSNLADLTVYFTDGFVNVAS